MFWKTIAKKWNPCIETILKLAFDISGESGINLEESIAILMSPVAFHKYRKVDLDHD